MPQMNHSFSAYNGGCDVMKKETWEDGREKYLYTSKFSSDVLLTR